MDLSYQNVEQNAGNEPEDKRCEPRVFHAASLFMAANLMLIMMMMLLLLVTMMTMTRQAHVTI